jgi:hypothetical protein
MFWIGIYPKPLFRFLERPVEQIVEQVNPGYYGAERAANPAAAPALAPAPAASGVMDMPGMPGMSMPEMDVPSGSGTAPALPDKK